ncbi:isoprenylcysteine carboxylmethyltransferase family protein [uncultured Maritimibacter sp.]|jgi:protein-S-isoprenylcysteine O-methyltransferase Ste14|uniref:methyltransferase family protein n=1 Tax=uncultured Maritimibacter sp. TaxID=991866 RepID=UPI000A6EBEF2|nr:isoprenylcysteine carboxylmethyltransferase family protein [uncultured Maritimibacter sp.]
MTPGTGLAALRWAGLALVVLGLLFMLAAVIELVRRRTSLMPRRTPSGFAVGGVYRISRNPIYLGDALVLAGACLWWDVPLALVLVPAFMWFLTVRYIRGEEAGLVEVFGEEARRYFEDVRRWL